MTNDERRAFDNLLLMCGTHHDEIDDDLDRWTVEALKELKRSHEAIYTGAVDLLRSTVGDVTEGITSRPATNLRALVDSRDEEELRGNLETVNAFAARLAVVPLPARSVLALIVNRSETTGSGWEEVTVPLPVLEQVANCSPSELKDHLGVLEHFKLAYVDTEPYDTPILVNAGNSTPGAEWPLLAELKELSRTDPGVIRRVLIDLDFTAFDG